MKRHHLIGLLALHAVFVASTPAVADVVINEILFRPGVGYPEITDREFIELYNADAAPANVSGWRFTRGVTFTFPANTTIPAGGYLVVAANLPSFQAAHPGVTNALGNWVGTLSNT